MKRLLEVPYYVQVSYKARQKYKNAYVKRHTSNKFVFDAYWPVTNIKPGRSHVYGRLCLKSFDGPSPIAQTHSLHSRVLFLGCMAAAALTRYGHWYLADIVIEYTI